MKIAALYDIHGNLPALHAVLEELQVIQPDVIVIGGDVVSGPLPGQTLARLRQVDTPIYYIQGNADRELVQTFDKRPLARRYLPPLPAKGVEEIQWLAQQITLTERDFLATQPKQLIFEIEKLGSILFCHATPHNDEELFTPLTPTQQLDTIFAEVTPDIVICGHTHIQFELSVGRHRILNAGSVGIPFAKEPGAYWLLLHSEGYEFRHTPFDGEAAAQAIRASGYPQAEDFIATNVLKLRSPEEMTAMFDGVAQAFASKE